jgi:hypothetical protein
LADCAGPPIEFAKAVEDGAADAKLCEGAKAGVLCAVEVSAGFDEADNTGVDEVFHFYLLGQAFADFGGNVINLWQLSHDEGVALIDVCVAAVYQLCLCCHFVIPFRTPALKS